MPYLTSVDVNPLLNSHLKMGVNYQPLSIQTSTTSKTSLPDPIIPMHEHSGPALPQDKQRRWNFLATLGVLTTLLGSVLLMSTKSSVVEQVIKKRVSKQTWNRITKNGNKSLGSRAWQIIGIGGLLQSINRYETAINTNQPSKILSALAATAQAIRFIFKVNWVTFSIGFITSAFVYAGEQNDIANSNHPDRRREWDINRLRIGYKNHTFGKELLSVTKFVIEDFKESFSKEHWKNSWNSLKSLLPGSNKKDWGTPQPYQSALGTQLSLLSLLLTCAQNTLGKTAYTIFSPLANTANLFGGAIPQIPLFTRAWENKDQTDGKLVILGSPLIALGRVLQMSPATQFLGGLGFIGDAVKGKGLALNSQKYLALLNEMRSLDKTAQEAPYMTASMIINMMQSSPDVQHRLREQMGQPRVDFLIDLLKEAKAAQENRGLTLHEFLAPMLVENSQAASVNTKKRYF